MKKLENKQKINRITMYPVAFTRCEIGGDFYKNELEIIMTPNEYYPDYTEVQSWAMERLDGKTLNIEDVVSIVHAVFNLEFKPKDLKVIDHVTGCRTHFDVIVEK